MPGGGPAVLAGSIRHRAGASFASIKRQGGWTNDGTVWDYIEAAQRFEDNAVSTLLAKANRTVEDD